MLNLSLKFKDFVVKKRSWIADVEKKSLKVIPFAGVLGVSKEEEKRMEEKLSRDDSEVLIQSFNIFDFIDLL